MLGQDRVPGTAAVRLALLLVAVAAVAPASPPVEAKCLARLDTHAAEFAVCTGATPCFMFLAEPPMVIVEGVAGADGPAAADAPPGMRSPFPCAAAKRLHGLTGASFDLHGPNGLWTTNSDLCVYAGGVEECTFTAMVAYMANAKVPGHAAYGMALGTAGMLVHTAQRSELAVPSVPIYEVSLSRRPVSRGLGLGARPTRRAPAAGHSSWGITTSGALPPPSQSSPLPGLPTPSLWSDADSFPTRFCHPFFHLAPLVPAFSGQTLPCATQEWQQRRPL